jgi:hypothetical protein
MKTFDKKLSVPVFMKHLFDFGNGRARRGKVVTIKGNGMWWEGFRFATLQA